MNNSEDFFRSRTQGTSRLSAERISIRTGNGFCTVAGLQDVYCDLFCHRFIGSGLSLISKKSSNVFLFGRNLFEITITQPTANQYRNILDFVNMSRKSVFLWKSKNTKQLLKNELLLCMALEYYNVRGEQGKPILSEMGSAVHAVKYDHNINTSNAAEQLLLKGLSKAFQYMPCINRPFNGYITYVPSYYKSPVKLPQALATNLSSIISTSTLLNASLRVEKKQIKTSQLAAKIAEWKRIMNTPGGIECDAFDTTRDIIIIDDVYQSGVSIYSFAEYLHGLGATNIFGLTCVKTWNDDQNPYAIQRV